MATTWAAFGLLGSSCMLRPHGEPPGTPLWRQLPLGEITAVNYAQGYVILQCIVLPSTGEVLKVYHGPKPIAELKVSKVARGEAAVAQIISGVPAKGDLVRRGPVIEGTGK